MTAGGVAGRDMQTHDEVLVGGRRQAHALRLLCRRVRQLDDGGYLRRGRSAKAGGHRRPDDQQDHRGAGRRAVDCRERQLAASHCSQADGDAVQGGSTCSGVQLVGVRTVLRRLSRCAGSDPPPRRSHANRAQPGERLGDGGARRRTCRRIDLRALLGIEVEHLRDDDLVESAADEQRGRAPGRGVVVGRLPELGDHQIVGDPPVGLLVAGQRP